MTKMMPFRPHPEATKSEVDIFVLIEKAKNSEHYFCLHSVGLARHERKDYAEADFVVIGPEGIFCLEVKGGNVVRKDGVWHIGWPGKQYTSYEGPFKQAQGTRWPLIEELMARTGLNVQNEILVGWGVVFPDITFEITDPEWDLDVVFDQRDKATGFVPYIRRLANYSRNRHTETGRSPPSDLGPQKIQQIVDCLRGDFDLVPTLGNLLIESELELVSLSEDQYKVLDFALDPNNPRVLCDGPGGTGKTLIALEASKRLAHQGLNVLLLCFNRNLAKFLGSRVGVGDGHLTVSSIFQYLRGVIRTGGMAEQLKDAEARLSERELFEEAYPRLFEDAALELLAEEELVEYDALLIDEGQDVLNTTVMNCLSVIVRGGLESGRWIIFYDSGLQSELFGRMDDKVVAYLKGLHPAFFALRENFRNPRGIVEEMCRLVDISPPICRRQLVSNVDYRSYAKPGDQGKKLRALLVELIRDGISPSSITILSGCRLEDSCLETDPPDVGKNIVVVGHVTDTGEIDDAISSSSVSAFKGLENDVIILVDVPRPTKGTEWDKAVVYVGMTRARTKVYALVDEDFINYRVGIQ